jgi:TPR repeat protein
LAEQGDAGAQFFLGDCYSKGAGVVRNYKIAIDFFLKAAKKKNIDALLSLSDCYHYGRGVPQDDAEAKRWLFWAKKINE